jgi:rubrerythrin
MNSQECFQTAARIESLAQEMYAGLAETFTGSPYLRQLFSQLSAEEGQHALRIRLLARHQGHAPWAAEAVEGISGSLGDLVAEISSMKADFAKPERAGDPGEVLRRVVDMERRFGTVHAEKLAHSADVEVASLFSVLAAQDARHRAIIEGAMTREGR